LTYQYHIDRDYVSRKALCLSLPKTKYLRRVLGRYAEYYNSARCHLSLDGNAPELREVESGPRRVRAIEHLGGLHHRYTRAA